MMVLRLSVLMFACLGAKTLAAVSGPSLADVLKEQNPGSKARALQSWSGDISPNDVLLLEGVVQQSQHKDWMLNYSARLLLRRKKPEVYGTSAPVETAERLFFQMTAGKVSSGAYDLHIDPIVSLGNEVVPLLLDLLEYNELCDRYRKDVAIKVLARLKDDRVLPALMNRVPNETYRNHMEQELLAILKHDSRDQTVDYVTAVVAEQKSDIDQEYVIMLLGRSDLSESGKMRLFSHYAQFGTYGKSAVSQELRRLGNQQAFDQLVGILQDGTYGYEFESAVYAMNGFKDHDVCDLFIQMLKKAPNHACSSLIDSLVGRNCTAAIPVLEERIKKASDEAEAVRCKVLAAGALCRLGKDYEKNATIARDHLRTNAVPRDATAYIACGWLHDNETIALLLSRIAGGKADKDVVRWAANALGQIGDTSALPALRSALDSVALDNFTDIGAAIARIGRTNKDDAATAEGELVQVLAAHLKSGPQQRESVPGSPETERKRQQREQILIWLRAHPGVARNIMEQAQSQPEYLRDSMVSLIQSARREE